MVPLIITEGPYRLARMAPTTVKSRQNGSNVERGEKIKSCNRVGHVEPRSPGARALRPVTLHSGVGVAAGPRGGAATDPRIRLRMLACFNSTPFPLSRWAALLGAAHLC